MQIQLSVRLRSLTSAIESSRLVIPYLLRPTLNDRYPTLDLRTPGAAAVGTWGGYPWSNSGAGVMQFGQDVKALASAQAPWDDWRMVMIEVDNKLPLYVQNDNQPFYFVFPPGAGAFS